MTPVLHKACVLSSKWSRPNFDARFLERTQQAGGLVGLRSHHLQWQKYHKRLSRGQQSAIGCGLAFLSKRSRVAMQTPVWHVINIRGVVNFERRARLEHDLLLSNELREPVADDTFQFLVCVQFIE